MSNCTGKEKNFVVNEYGQRIGLPLPEWSVRPHPDKITLQGRFCRLEPLDIKRHADELYDAYTSAPDGRDWTYLPVGPFQNKTEYLSHLKNISSSTDMNHYAVIDEALNCAVGTIALMRVDTLSGSIEVGWVTYSPHLKQKPSSTEAQYLLMQYVFETLGYRRYEWKCDALNTPSRKAALRLGFSFEGIFRQVTVYKQRSRDTAWFSVLDKEWPSIEKAFMAWLNPENFDSNGQQYKSLSEYRKQLG